MTRTKLFRSNRSQAVRLPKSLAFPDSVKEVSIVRDGKRRVIAPSNAVWDDFFDSPGIDLPPRNQPDLRRQPSELENFAARLEVLSFDIAAAHHAADIRATLERQGRASGGYDILIAGHARSRALIVVTGNRGEFDRVPGLQCEDWG